MWFAALALAVGVLAAISGSARAASAVERLAFARGVSPDRYDIWVLQNGVGHRVTRSCGWDWWPDWSPDGTRIAFVRACPSSPFDIFTVRANGTGLRRLTRGTPMDQWPTWSPDVRKIAFVRGDDVGAELYVVNAAGGGVHRLTRNAVADDTPAWSPDGKTIAFTRRIGGHNRLMLMRADGTHQRSLRGIRGGEPAWSPDGKQIAFARGVDGAARETASIYIANVGAKGVRKVTVDRPGSVSHHPSWSANGRLIAFMGSHGSLYVVRPNGTGLQRLTRARFEDVDPAWLR
jgi:TolB protein